MDRVRQRNSTNFDQNQSIDSANQTMISGSVMLARERLKAVTEQKMLDAKKQKDELKKKLNERVKIDKSILKAKQQNRKKI